MQGIWSSVRYAWRQLRKSPGFAATVVVTLALGVGANTVVFSVLNAVILRPLDLPQADRLWFFNRMGQGPAGGWATPSESYPDYRDVRDRNHTFNGITAYRWVPVGVRQGETVTLSSLYEASGNYFDVLGVQPVLGRFFHASDEHGVNGSPYAVLSYEFWQRRFNGDAGVVGRTVELNKHPFTVLGVAPASFRGTEIFIQPDLWTPILNAGQLETYTDFEARGDRGMWWIGRLKPGVTKAQAEADVNAVAKGMERENRDSDDGLGFRLSKPGLIGELLGGPVRAFLLGVMALAGLVLLAACANLGSLFAARAADRQRELAVRMALGASRGALVRQMLAESLVVSLIGGAAGVAVAMALLHALSLWRPSADFPVSVAVHADVRVFVLALVLSVGSGVFFGVVPVRQVWRTDAYAGIKGSVGGAAAASGRGRRWTLRDLLLVMQIVLCSVLVTASLVAVRGLARSLDTRYGFEPRGALLAKFDLKMAGYTDGSALPVQKRALEVVEAVPGVEAAGFANTLPLAIDSSDSGVYRDGTTDMRASNIAAEASYFDVSPGYMAAAGTRLLAGRDFTWHDDAQAPHVAMVNERFVREVFGEKVGPREAVGRYFMLGMNRQQVVGVVEDGKYVTLTEDPRSAMFFPIMQSTNAQTVMVVRGQMAAEGVRRALAAIDPSMPVRVESWPRAMGMALFPAVAATASLGVMGGLAAMLAVTGIFGMASYSVSKRMRELGLRVALGAGRGQLLGAALGRPAWLLAVGSGGGLVLGVLASRLLGHIVYQATSEDPVVLGGVVVAMAVLALGATWLPARKALRVDPASLLREE